MKVFLVPEVDLVDLLHIECFICEGCHMKVTPGGEHLSVWLEPLLSMQIGLQHSLIEQHVSHGLGNDDVDLLWQIDLLDLS